MQSSVPSSPKTGANTHIASDALGLWEPKRTLTLESARNHTARIRVLRKVLVASAAVLAAIVTWQFINQPAGFNLQDDPEETVRMVNPKYSGRTNDGLPYYLTATEAVRKASNSTAVNLTTPLLNFYRALGSEPSKVTAVNGVYDDVNNILSLSETVKLGTDDGYACATGESKIFTKDKRITGNSPISCSGSFGDVTGNSYTITDDYKVYTFADGMSAKITRESSNETPDGNFGFEGDAPIHVKAETATYKSTTTTLSGHVDVSQDAARVQSRHMVIYRAKLDKTVEDTADDSLKLGAITKIDAKGNFVYSTADRRLTGNRGIYDRAKNIITVTGNVLLKQDDGTVVTGEKLVYDMTKKRAKVGKRCTGSNCGRVNFELQGKN